ncbi:MAG: BamA/TamA family outer membrane protein, partial [Flavobacteriales bacterium]
MLLLCAMLMCACSNMRNLDEGQTFLRTHQISVVGAPAEYTIANDDLISLTRQKPNRRILYWRFNHSVYLMVNKNKLEKSRQLALEKCERKNSKRIAKGKQLREKCQTWRTFWAETVGEPTVVFDSVRMVKSAQQMSVYLQKKGYFNNVVNPVVHYNQKKDKCVVDYQIHPNEPYKLRNISYRIEDPAIAENTESFIKASILDSAIVFDLDVLDKERENITTYLNNHGYFNFTKDYINYDAQRDTSRCTVDVTLILSQPLIPSTEYPDSLVAIPHKKYFIGDIYVHTDYVAAQNYAPADTLLYEGLKIVYTKVPNLTPELISCLQGYHTGDLFQREQLDRTYKRYTQLGVLRATTIQLIPDEERTNGIHTLQTHIHLSPSKKQYYRVEPQVTHRSGNMGIYGNLLYSNRNIFHGAEAMDVRIITGLEASQTLVQTGNASGSNIQRNLLLNTFEIGPELTYRVPRLWPLGCDFMKRSSEPQTSFSAAFNYQQRPDYKRTLSQLKYTYNWIENPTKVTRITWDVVDFSIIKIDKSTDFQDFLESLNDKFLANSYTDHLIHAMSGTLTWNTQKAHIQRKYFYSRSSASFAGNTLRLIMHHGLHSAQDDNGSYLIAGIRFAQYVRLEHDMRFYFNANEKNAFVMRMYGGAGVPYGNLNVLPFEKSFFSGGSNGMRAWQARTLGPGSSR